ncbi:MAG: glutamate-5-semialdehyde dehydrogenase [Candidatus Magasanikbacteria bacterium CG10_big_fil_rev_8_21_14_0_10_40_10]|uniref:Gamma-glutamyl phosphate reductase n=1 Tax=Candidatus Magasanikbacteria bacterium CG10_big_fil_rev_8_21_14_0_10_40_10 TaxID=1974648 RepID=A0A2M6W486_9BACT|nr:MAG: glutamate-5-semialdehyde dehydrogenase [Candidatus Magasanikbacteria bacterium CG10_big_fil_rev_8_21_14_0_10_40_10]
MTKTQAQIHLAKLASINLAQYDDQKISQVLLDLAVAIEHQTAKILQANRLDADKMDTSDPKLSRLVLDENKIKNIADGIRQVSQLKTPLRKILEKRILDNGLFLKRVSAPLGVVGVVYEARPNVTPDIFSLCFKSGNACVLKGGSDAHNSHQAFVEIITDVLEKNNLDKNCIQLLSPRREAVQDLLEARGLVDLVVARGSRSLIDFTRDNAKVPFIETGAGVVHLYFDKGADVKKGKLIVENSKTSRPAVCNALDTLIVHEDELKNLPKLVGKLAEHQVELRADKRAFESLSGRDSFGQYQYPTKLLKHSTAKDYDTEFLSLKMAIKTVVNLAEAIQHIGAHSTGHTEVILSANQLNIERFLREVDSAAVYSNCATVFTDGNQYGLGAEVGISTQKLHARGPMGLDALTSYKWILQGDGQVRE